jgi:hypothetical protein
LTYLGKKLCDELLAVRLTLGGAVAVALPAVPAAAEVLEENGWGGGEKLQEVFAVEAAHGSVSQARELCRMRKRRLGAWAWMGTRKNGGDNDLASSTYKGPPELTSLPEAIVCCVGTKHEQQPQGASQQQVWRRGQSSDEELDGLGKNTICNPYQGGKDCVGN